MNVQQQSQNQVIITPALTNGCIPKLAHTWEQILGSFKHPIHPSEPVVPEYSEFVTLSPKIRIRVIHVHATDLSRTINGTAHDIVQASKRSSLTEEYWFTKWNKPLKIGNCSCSFRRSFRFSMHNDLQLLNIRVEEESQLATNEIPKRIVDVETFVERIVQETIYEAIQEYAMVTESLARTNLAFQSDEYSSTNTVLRRENLLKTPSTESKLHTLCNHKRIEKKPFIMLFHGIGKSADVWWLVINSLLHKGYEVIAPDMLGHGFSSAPNEAKTYNFKKLLTYALAVFDHYVSSDSKCILIGHSYGCSISSALYSHRSSQIVQLILISGGGPTPLAAPVKENEISPFGFVHSLFRPLIFCGLKRSFLFSSRGKHFSVCDKETAIPRQVLMHISKGQVWPEGDATFHRRILVPTLLVHGLQDKQVTLVQQCEMERTIPRAFLELIPNAGHMAMIDSPEHLSHMILCFIDTFS